MSSPIIIYPVKHGGSKWGNMELRLSLRSLDAHFRLEDGARPKVFVLTTAPLVFLNRSHLAVVECKGYREAVEAAWALAREHSPTGDYLWMNDDILFLKPTRPSDLATAIHCGRMKLPEGAEKDVGAWRRKLHRLRDRLAEMGIHPYNFSTHSPYLFNADMMEMVAGIFGLPYKQPLETAYYNYWYDRVPSRRSDCRVVRHTSKPTAPSLEGKRYLNYADGALNDMFKGFLQGLFPHPSYYELPGK